MVRRTKEQGRTISNYANDSPIVVSQKAEHIPQVFDQLDHQDEYIGLLSEICGELESRLEPVMNKYPDTDVAPEVAKELPLTPLANRIRENNNNMLHSVRLIRSIISRLEI